MSPDQYCQEKAAQSGSSFYYSFLFLPEQKRRAITALYAFCREVDDVVDECSDAQIALTKLHWWRQEVARLFGQAKEAATHPVMLALQPYLSTYQITAERLLQIIDGMQMDLEQTRYLDFVGLQKYCFHVAGVVGLLAAEIFGRTDENTLAYAEKLGLAFQLTNIIRDVGEDARRGRIYIPVNELQQFEVKAADLLQGKYSDNFVRLMEFQTSRAKATYREALRLLPDADIRAQRAGLMMAAIYNTTLDEVSNAQYQVLHQRISLTPLRKLWLAWKTWLRPMQLVKRMRE